MKSEKKKKMLNFINFLKPWSKSLDRKHHKLKNYETQSLTNQTLKDETRKKNQSHKRI
jgi:hypothetical protein